MAKTVNIPSQIVVQTAAQWAVDATIYSAKRILITSDATYGATDQRKFKIADGVQTWAQLNYFPVSGYDDATSSIQTQLDSKQTTAVFFAFSSNTYTDSTSYYIGQALNPVTATSQTGGVALKAGVITACIISVHNAGTVASNESCTLNLVHGTNYGTTSLIANDVKIDANRQSARYVSGLNITVTECSSLININIPVLATNPNGLQLRITIFYA